MECLKQASQQQSHIDQLNSFIESLKSQYRISKLDQYDFVCDERISSTQLLKQQTNEQDEESSNVKQEIITTKPLTEIIDLSSEISKLYHDCKFDQVIDSFVNNNNNNNNQNQLSRESSEFLSKSIIKSV